MSRFDQDPWMHNVWWAGQCEVTAHSTSMDNSGSEWLASDAGWCRFEQAASEF